MSDTIPHRLPRRWSELEGRIRKPAPDDRHVRGEVRPRLPNGGRVPYRDVFGVFRALRRAGVDDVYLW